MMAVSSGADVCIAFATSRIPPVAEPTISGPMNAQMFFDGHARRRAAAQPSASNCENDVSDAEGWVRLSTPP